jgi:hypothetical protein
MRLSKAQNWSMIKSIIHECFSGDEGLVNKYHIKSGTSLKECVEDTCSVLKDFTNFDFEFYKVMDGEMVVGFIGVEPEIKFLTTFCLKKEYRSKEYKDGLWKLIVGFFNGENFNSGLYKKNERAIKYLVDNGCEIKSEGQYNDHPIVVLNYLKKEVNMLNQDKEATCL